MIDGWLWGSTIAGFACTWIFVLRYSMVRWNVTAGGRAIMALSLAVAVLATGALVRRLGYEVAGLWLISLGWSMESIAILWRLRQLNRAQRRLPHHPIGPTVQDDRESSRVRGD